MMPIRKAKSATIATLGVDIGKNTFHLVGLDKRGAIVLHERLSRASSRGPLSQHPALLGRHGGLRRRPSPGPAPLGPWPRRAADGGQVRSAVLS